MSFKRITASQAKNILDNSGILVDIRDAETFTSDHDSGAIHLTQDTLPGFLATTDKKTPVLVICYHGNSSQMVAEFLSEEGFEEVYSIDGGYEMWNL